MANCLIDTDCPGSEVCFANVSWSKENFCFCETWHGWKGRNCTELDIGGIYNLISVCVQLALALIGLAVCMFLLFKLIQEKRYKKTAKSAKATFVFVTLTTCSLISWRILSLYILLTPELVGKVVTNDDDGSENSKLHPVEVDIEKVFVALSVAFNLLATMNVFIYWIDIAVMTKNLRASGNTALLSKFKKGIIILEVIWIISAVIIMPIASTYLYFIGAFYVILNIVGFLYGRWKIIEVLSSISDAVYVKESKNPLSSRSINEKLIQRISISTNVIVTGGTVTLVGGAIYSWTVIENWKEFSKPGEISLSMVGHELMPLGIIIAVAGVIWYVFPVLAPRKQTPQAVSTVLSKNITSSKASVETGILSRKVTAEQVASFI